MAYSRPVSSYGLGEDSASRSGGHMTRSIVTAAARTAITGWHRGQADLTNDQLTATVFAAMPVQPDIVLLGNTVGPGGNIARIASLAAGWQTTGAVTLDAQCGTSLVG